MVSEREAWGQSGRETEGEGRAPTWACPEGEGTPTGQNSEGGFFSSFFFLLFQKHFQKVFKKQFKSFYVLVKTTHSNKSYAPACMHNNVAIPCDEF